MWTDARRISCYCRTEALGRSQPALSLSALTLFKQHHRARPSIHQEAHGGESVVPVGRKSIEDDRWLQSDASDPERANPVAAPGCCGWATPVRSYPLWHRCVVHSPHLRSFTTVRPYLQQIRCGNFERDARCRSVRRNRACSHDRNTYGTLQFLPPWPVELAPRNLRGFWGYSSQLAIVHTKSSLVDGHIAPIRGRVARAPGNFRLCLSLRVRCPLFLSPRLPIVLKPIESRRAYERHARNSVETYGSCHQHVTRFSPLSRSQPGHSPAARSPCSP